MKWINLALDVILAPFRVLLNPWKAMHGEGTGALAQLSVAGMASLMTFLFLLLVQIAWIAVLYFGGGTTDITDYWKTLAVTTPIIIVTTIIVYYMVKYWTQDVGERFPDIETAWKLGLAEVKRLGFDLRRTPLYFVLGSENSMKDQELFASSGFNMVLSHFPKGRGLPLRWYASEDAIFVVLTHTGCLTSLARSAADQTVQERVQVPMKGPGASVGVSATCWPTEDESVVMTDDSGVRSPQAAPVVSNQVGYQGTMQTGDESVSSVIANQTGGQKSKRPRINPPTREATDEQQRRLAFLCRLAEMARRPFCAVNGVLVQLPLNLIVADDHGTYTKEAVASDLQVLCQRFQLRFPAMTLVTGWDEDLGFQEFTRRLGADKRRDNRFGKGFGIGDPPLKDQLGALCMHACRAFEHFIYDLFRKPDALSKPGNRALYSLLCKVRRYLYPRLDRIVADGMGIDDGQPDALAPLNAGCYFAAASSHEDTRAFVIKAFERLVETNEDLEWTAAAERSNNFYYTLGYASLVVSALLLGAIPVLFLVL